MIKKSILTTLSLALVLVWTSSCDRDSTFRGWEFMPDMYRGPAVETYSPNDQFSDSLSARKPAEGTIPRGFMAYQEFSPGPSGYDSAKSTLKMPSSIPTDSTALAHGREIYSIFCQQCHGEKGEGQGVLVQNGKYAGVPAYGDRDINMGSIFHTVTYGKNLMGAHASQVTPEERWKVAQYVLKLRAEQVGDDKADKEDVEEESQSAQNDEDGQGATEVAQEKDQASQQTAMN